MTRSHVLALGFTLLLGAATSYGQSQAKLPAIQRIIDAKPRMSVFAKASLEKPIVVRSKKDAARSFTGDQLARLIKRVDFEKQVVLIFAWRGSGQDRLDYDVLESFPEQIVFRHKPGRTRDLRHHSQVFVVRSNVRWRTPGAGEKPSGLAEYIQVEVKGKLDSQVAAIGGETTGVAVPRQRRGLELDFGRNAKLRDKASELHGKTVVLRGRLQVRPGVEIKQRWIVVVRSLEGT